jgi:hypothetical protein
MSFWLSCCTNPRAEHSKICEAVREMNCRNAIESGELYEKPHTSSGHGLGITSINTDFLARRRSTATHNVLSGQQLTIV